MTMGIVLQDRVSNDAIGHVNELNVTDRDQVYRHASEAQKTASLPRCPRDLAPLQPRT